MIDTSNINLYEYSYPILKSENLIKSEIYKELKKNWPEFNKFRTTNGGQLYRENIEIIRNNENYRNINEHYRNLYDEFDSKYFRNFLKEKFDNFDISNNDFIGDFDNSQLIMHIAESRNGYENPWHVDTRKRIIQFLFYFGDEDIIEGGELGIACHIKKGDMSEYKQYPKKDDLYNIQYFKPNDNLALFILSQNNSYHKGCSTKGIRRFIYAGFTNNNGDAWKTKNWNCNRNFQQELNNNK